MRDIKFRAWDKQENMMLYKGFYDRNWYTESKAGKCVKGLLPEDKHYQKLMQFTGLKDKNGVEIYEGDIIRIKHPHKNRTFKGDIYFDEGKFKARCFYFPHYDIPNDCFSEGMKHIEIIGNIYENPELLK